MASNNVVLGKQTRRDGFDLEVTTRFGHVIPLGKTRELLPYGFSAKAPKGDILVLFEGDDVRSPVLLPVSDQDGAPFLEEGDSGIWTANGGWVAAREAGGVDLWGREHGGLVIAQELKRQLDKTNEVVKALMDVITGTLISEAGGGAISALQVALKTALAGKALGEFDSIESTGVFHGNGAT